MPFDKFQRYVKSQGFCCPLAFFKARNDETTSMLAEASGLTERGIRFWREDYRKKRLTCPNRDSCLLAKLQARAGTTPP